MKFEAEEFLPSKSNESRPARDEPGWAGLVPRKSKCRGKDLQEKKAWKNHRSDDRNSALRPLTSGFHFPFILHSVLFLSLLHYSSD